MRFLSPFFPTRYRAEKWKKEEAAPWDVVVRVCAPEFPTGIGWAVISYSDWVVWRRGG